LGEPDSNRLYGLYSFFIPEMCYLIAGFLKLPYLRQSDNPEKALERCLSRLHRKLETP